MPAGQRGPRPKGQFPRGRRECAAACASRSVGRAVPEQAGVPSGRRCRGEGPARFSSCSRVTPPGRRMTGGSAVRERIVDSTPTRQGPPSSTRSTASPSCSTTCSARRRAHVAERVRAGGGDRRPGGPDQRERRGVAGDAHADRVETGGHEVGHRGLPRQDESERPRPEALGERRDARVRRWSGWGAQTSHPRHLAGAGHVDDQRVERRSHLDREDASDRPGVERVRPQAVDGLGGEGDEAAASEEASGLLRSAPDRPPAGRERSGRFRGGRSDDLTAARARRPACRRRRGCRGRPSSGARSRCPLSARAERKRPRSSSEARANRPVGSLTSITESRTATPAKRRASSRASSGPVLIPDISTQARFTGPPRRAAWRRMAAASAGTS